MLMLVLMRQVWLQQSSLAVGLHHLVVMLPLLVSHRPPLLMWHLPCLDAEMMMLDLARVRLLLLLTSRQELLCGELLT